MHLSIIHIRVKKIIWQLPIVNIFQHFQSVPAKKWAFIDSKVYLHVPWFDQ